MPGVLLWGWDTENKKWVPVIADTEGRLKMSIVIARLDDINDVSVPSPSVDEVLYWDGTAWKAKAMPGGGDMTKAVYDTNNNNVVDNSEKLEGSTKAQVQDHAPKAHKTSHQKGGADEISIAGLAGEPAELTTHKANASAHHSNVLSLTFIIDGGGSAITTGQKGHLEIPFACTITQVTMLADQSGSIVVDIWKDTYANFPPTDADSITASAPPTISSAQKSQDATLTDWTTAIAAGDILAFNVDSCTTITRVTISLKVTKT
jgi:hypothetical protein